MFDRDCNGTVNAIECYLGEMNEAECLRKVFSLAGHIRIFSLVFNGVIVFGVNAALSPTHFADTHK